MHLYLIIKLLPALLDTVVGDNKYCFDVLQYNEKPAGYAGTVYISIPIKGHGIGISGYWCGRPCWHLQCHPRLTLALPLSQSQLSS